MKKRLAAPIIQMMKVIRSKISQVCNSDSWKVVLKLTICLLSKCWEIVRQFETYRHRVKNVLIVNQSFKMSQYVDYSIM